MIIQNLLRPFKAMGNPLLRIKNREYQNLPIYILLLTCTGKWFIEGIVNQTILTVVFLALGLGLFVLKKGIHFQRATSAWVIYAASILFSVLIGGLHFNVLGRALIFILLLFYAFLADYREFDMRRVLKFLVVLAVFYAFFIFVQFVFTEGFNDLYFPLLSDTTRVRARLYSRRGYYFGLHTSPHEVAGILAFAIAVLLLHLLVSKKDKKSGIKQLALVAVLFVALILTGKKGVLLAFVGAFTAIVVIFYGSKKQWKKVLIAIGAIALMAVAVLVIIRLFPDAPLFNRLNKFLDQLFSGQSVNSNRVLLYQHAINAWKEHKLFGIGWYGFMSLSTSELGYNVAHQVNLDYLQWLCETGIFGLILNLIPVVFTLYQAVVLGFKSINNMSENNTKWIVLFAIFVQIFTVVYAFIEIPFYDVFFFGVYVLSCMIINSVYEKETGSIGKLICRFRKA